MSKIKAILFDLDGTLRDSREAIYGAIEETLGHFGIAADRRLFQKESHSLRQVHAKIATNVAYEEFRDRYDASYNDDVLGSIIIYEHVVDVLDAFMSTGYMLAIVSSSRYAREGLEQHNLTKYFDVIVDGNDVSQHKPHPEPLFTATEQLGVRAEEAVMVGDMVVDIEAGKAAGVAATVGLTHGFGEHKDLEAAGADHIIDSFAELPDVLNKLAGGVK